MVWLCCACSVVAVLIVVISDIGWGGLPPFIVALKSTLALITIAAGHIGYKIVRIFFRQLREARRSALPIFACFSIATECEGKRRREGWPGPPTKDDSHTFSRRFHSRWDQSHDLASLHDPSTFGSRFLRRSKTHVTGYTSNVWHLLVTTPSNRPNTRRYWTTLGNCGPLYCQAVQKRLKLFKDDMLRYATEIGKLTFSLLSSTRLPPSMKAVLQGKDRHGWFSLLAHVRTPPVSCSLEG